MFVRAREDEELVSTLVWIGLVKEELKGFFELSFFAKRLDRVVVITGKGFDAGSSRVAKGH